MKKFLGICFCVLITLSGPAYGQSTEFGTWLTDLKYEALQEGVSVETLEKAFMKVKPLELVLRLDQNQPEFKLSLKGYLDRVISETRVRKGLANIYENKALLDGVAARYGVQSRFLVALWGVETDFGRVLGSFPVIDALATLAYDPRRSDFFRAELLHALHIIDDGLATVKSLEGSWAGAFGGLQFLPSVYRVYAQDFNQNGRIDIWQEPEDLFGTGANYLAKSGWKFDQTWGRQVVLPDSFDSGLFGLKTSKKISEWQSLGVRRLNGTDLPERDLVASIVQPDQDDPRVFMVYNNFHTLLKWNRSLYYAVAVGLLSDRLREAP